MYLSSSVFCSRLGLHWRLPRTLKANKCLTIPFKPRASSSDTSDDEPSDIDALAARLSAEAEKMRAAGEKGSQQSETSRVEEVLAPMGFERQVSRETQMLAEMGEGGFFASDFELLQELGQISVQQQESADDTYSLLTTKSTVAAVIAYTASYHSGMPFQDPVVTLLKEYLPGAQAVAINELSILSHLTGMPDRNSKWQVAAAVNSDGRDPPIVRLLGYFSAAMSDSAVKLASTTDREEALFIVQKWEGLAPLTLWPSAQQTSGIGLGRLFGAVDTSLDDRVRMIRSIVKGCLRALSYCHSYGVLHGALGSGSILLSSFDDKSAARLTVKFDNFGFARRLSVPAAGEILDDTPIALGCRGDLRQLSVVFLEAILGALAENGPSPATSADSIQRLLAEIYDWDMEGVRYYCEGDEEWGRALKLLDDDEGAGWDLLVKMSKGQGSAAELSEHRFCNPVK